MNKKEYLDKLESGLSSMAYKDVKEILAEIEEHFSVGVMNGKSEEQICKDLGSADDLAKAYIEGTTLPLALTKKQEPVNNAPENNKGYDTSGVIFVILFNLLIVIPVWLMVFAFLCALVGVEIALIFGLVALICAIPAMGNFIATGIVLSVLIALILVVIAVICYFAIKYFFWGTAQYIKWNKKVWKQGF